jgi:hypothetical protein
MKIAGILGIAFPCLILALGFDLNEITIVFWPTMLGLMALGGKITTTGDYAYIVFLVILNMLIYLSLTKLLLLAYCALSNKFKGL